MTDVFRGGAMFSQDDDSQQNFVLAVLSGLLALVVSVVIAAAVYKSNLVERRAAVAPSARLVGAEAARVQIPAAVPIDAQAASDAAGVSVENGVLKFYFASGKAELAPGAGDVLAGVVASAQAGRKLLISGFHDTTGDAGRNQTLARQRALAVRDLLGKAGVAPQQIEISRPEQVQGGNGAEARRVEVTLQ
jgi:outer membrane protein OmpA-like peptidoglycan-associated protein